MTYLYISRGLAAPHGMASTNFAIPLGIPRTQFLIMRFSCDGDDGSADGGDGDDADDGDDSNEADSSDVMTLQIVMVVMVMVITALWWWIGLGDAEMVARWLSDKSVMVD